MNIDDTPLSRSLHPPASSSVRALWSAIGGLTLAVAGLAGTLVYQQRQSDAATLAAARPVVAPASVFKSKAAAAPVPYGLTAIKSVASRPPAGRRVAPPPVLFSAPVRAPLPARG